MKSDLTDLETFAKWVKVNPQYFNERPCNDWAYLKLTQSMWQGLPKA